MLVEIAIADAFGAGFEMTTAADRKRKKLHVNGNKYYAHNLPGHLPAGSYTDDTQMSIAIAEALLEKNSWDLDYIAHKFVSVFKHDPRNGYSRKLQNILNRVRYGSDFRAVIVPDSTGCGAAMRSIPIGLFKDPITVWTKAATQAKVTHNNREGVLTASAVALAAHHQYYKKGTIPEMCDWVSDMLNDKTLFADDYTVPKFVSAKAMDVVPTAFSLLKTITHTGDTSYKRSLLALLYMCVSCYGDTDSIAAIAVGIASLSDMFVNDLPDWAHDGLENGKFGHDFLQALDNKLFAKFNRE